MQFTARPACAAAITRALGLAGLCAMALAAPTAAAAVSSLRHFNPLTMPEFQPATRAPDQAGGPGAESDDVPSASSIDAALALPDVVRIERDAAGNDGAPGSAQGGRPSGREAAPDSDDVDPVATLCAQIDDKLTSVDFEQCMGFDLKPSGAVSNKRKTIATRDFAPDAGEPSARVLLVGGIHGDEYSSVTAVFHWLERLEADEGGGFHWRVVPLLNPDGLLMPPNQSQRMNANGVDLNRNFPTPNWQTEAVDYWVNRTRRNKRRYPGPEPLSEPESRWLASQIETYRPDAVISVHAPHGIVDFDGPRIPPENLGPLELRLLGTYPGSMGRYIGVYKGIPLLTIELESALRLPADDDMAGIWFDMIDWLSAKVGDRSSDRVAAEGAPATDPRVSEATLP